MKKINQIIMLILVVVTFSSCNKSDDEVSIVGNWDYYRTGVSFNGTETLQNYQHQSTCTDDYVEVVNGGVIKNVLHSVNASGCQNNTTIGAWSRNGNQVTITYGSQTSVFEIMTLNNATLKMRSPNTQQNGAYNIVIYNRQ